MPDLLNFELAASLARRLMLIPEFPRSKETFDGVANCLQRWCRGAIVDNRIWQPEDQAQWIVDEAVSSAADSGEEWKGIGQLRQIFREKFERPALPSGGLNIHQQAIGTGCGECGGTGWRIVEHGGVSGAEKCPACGGKVEPAKLCPKCAGKGAVLVDGNTRRRWCECVPEEQRRQYRAWVEMMEAPRSGSPRDEARQPEIPAAQSVSPERRAQIQFEIDAELRRKGRLA